MIQILTYLIPLVAVGALVIGLAAMIMPVKMSGIFGVAVEGKASAFVIGMGVRDLFIGGAILVLYFMDLITATAWVLLFLGGVSLSDFAVVRKYGSSFISFTHFTGAVLVSALAIGLMTA